MKIWTTEMVVDNTEFKVTFWKDSWGLMWTEVEKKVWVQGWLSKKYRPKYETILKYWTDKDPVERVKELIADYLFEQEKEKNIEKALDKLCQ